MGTPTKLGDILDLAELAEAHAARHVRMQVHPTEPLAILNYTETCAYDNAWTPTTLACRGLIYNTDTREVLARPFRKFFNYGQPGAPTMDLNAPAVVTDKMDGSLGILYPVPSGGWAIATRGSFTSEQAEHATRVWQERYADRFTPSSDVTMLFEIVYPANRIVVDYGDTDDLVLLGAVDIETGRSLATSCASVIGARCWPGPMTETFAYASLADALAAEPRPNREGLVVHCLDTDERVKIKQQDYVELHRIVTGLNARVVWRHLIEGKPIADLIAPLPDEFHGWCLQVAESIEAAVDAQEEALNTEYRAIIGYLVDSGAEWGRKDFAAHAVKSPNKWAMFLLLDKRPIRGELLKRADPGPNVTPSGRIFTEETA